MFPPLPADWAAALPSIPAALADFVAGEYATRTVFPPAPEIFTALQQSPLASTRVVILGQDPYHDEGQAHGLAFSVRECVKPPPSLRNIFQELVSDIGCPRPTSGSLVPWAAQGVLLLNTVLTVRAHAAHSHAGKGWESFTDEVIRAVAAQTQPVVFILWGAPAQKKRTLIGARHTVIEAPHPSPLSAYRGFFGSKPFSTANAALVAAGRETITWEL